MRQVAGEVGAGGDPADAAGGDGPDAGDHHRRGARGLGEDLAPVHGRDQVAEHQDAEDAEEVGRPGVADVQRLPAQAGDQEGAGDEEEERDDDQRGVAPDTEEQVEHGQHRVGAGDGVDRLPAEPGDPEDRAGEEVAPHAEGGPGERGTRGPAPLPGDREQPDHAEGGERGARGDDQDLPEVQLVEHHQGCPHGEQQDADVRRDPGREELAHSAPALVVRDGFDTAGLHRAVGVGGGRVVHEGGSVRVKREINRSKSNIYGSLRA